MINTHHITPERIHDLPLGLETDYFRFQPEARTTVRERYNINANEVVLLFAGYMFRRKALEILITTVANLSDVPLRLVFAGDGPADYITELKKMAERLGVTQKIIFAGVGGRQQMIEWYSAADIGVWPGNNSLVVMEAMACRLPVIMAKMQLAHLIGHDNGLTVPYGDQKALDESIRSLASDPELRFRMGLAGERAVRELYSYEAAAKKVSAWMEELVARQHSRA